LLYPLMLPGACVGVLKVVFATETLAAGINMPARSTVISTLSRRRDRGITMLTHNELLQMAGRAGRRGFDTQGKSTKLPVQQKPRLTIQLPAQCATWSKGMLHVQHVVLHGAMSMNIGLWQSYPF